MSRCFPYPPPGLVKIGARGGEGSIKSTKLQKEKPKTETERRKERKGQKAKTALPTKQTDVHADKIKRLGDLRSLCYEKKYTSSGLAILRDDSSRSGLSEEHEQPLAESLFYQSDGTDSSKKRKLDAPSPPAVQSGKKIKIRFTLKRQSDPNAPLGKEPVCSTSTSRDAVPQIQPPPQIINTRVEEPRSSSADLKTVKSDGPCSSSADLKTVKSDGPCSSSADLKTVKSDGPSKHKDKKPKPSMESMYQALFDEWAAPSLTESYDADEEWLFGAKQQGKKAPGILKTETCKDVLRPAGSDLQPRAHFLQEAQIFALPFTVPF